MYNRERKRGGGQRERVLHPLLLQSSSARLDPSSPPSYCAAGSALSYDLQSEGRGDPFIKAWHTLPYDLYCCRPWRDGVLHCLLCQRTSGRLPTHITVSLRTTRVMVGPSLGQECLPLPGSCLARRDPIPLGRARQDPHVGRSGQFCHACRSA